MKVVYNNWIPFRGFRAINLFGVLFVRRDSGAMTPSNFQHEAIHTAQMKELLYVLFYLIYFAEWIVRLFMKGNAYRNISFEKEAYANQGNPEYLKERRWWAMWR